MVWPVSDAEIRQRTEKGPLNWIVRWLLVISARSVTVEIWGYKSKWNRGGMKRKWKGELVNIYEL